MAEEHRIYFVQMSEWQLSESIINLISTAGFKCYISKGLQKLAFFFYIYLDWNIVSTNFI